MTVDVPHVDVAKCIGCGRCGQICQYSAIVCIGDQVLTFEQLCPSCGGCWLVCPADAIDFKDAINGQWFVSDTRFGPMVHARLGAAEENSGKLVSLIRKQARRIADERGARANDDSPLLVDGSPGIGCPVIASITGADLVLVVTEPTLPGRHDLDRVAQLTAHFGIPTAVCINKWDINPDVTETIEADLRDKGLALAGKIDYDPAVTQAQVAEETVIEYAQNGTARQIVSVWNTITESLRTTK